MTHIVFAWEREYDSAGDKASGKRTKCIAFIGDSTFIHTGFPGSKRGYQNTDITIAVHDTTLPR
jgi:TPP-dependent indolepyruvate ferredoxin oxidoreductase alpha subunit